MMIRYSRSGGHRPPRDREILAIEDDGSFSMWRSIGSAVQPPSPIGRFAGQLDSHTLEELITAVNAVAREGDLVIKPKPGSAVVNIETDQVKARMGIHDEPDSSWPELANLLHGLLGELTKSPLAAITLDVSEDGTSARLIHLGKMPLLLDLKQLNVRAVLWEGHIKVGDWSTSETVTGELDPISADVNWEMDLPFNHNFEADDDQKIVAYVTFSISNDNRFIPVKLTSM